jgi:2-polyprenyl-3-methyl-5-hydroxy-6-metoxy-1,4-benzoquinol methylase
MPSIQDEKGYNQGYRPSKSVEVRTERRCDYILSKMELKQDTRILEIGCGIGRHSYILAKKTGKYVLGTDISRAFIEEAKSNYSLPNLEYKLLDFNDQAAISDATGGQKFDYVVGDGILHHLYYNLDNSLASIHELLKPGGRMIFLEPNFFNPYCLVIFNIPLFRKLAKLEPGEMALRKGFISDKLELAGFENINVEYRDFLIPGTPDFMIKVSIILGNAIEKIIWLKMLSQSIFISAEKK